MEKEKLLHFNNVVTSQSHGLEDVTIMTEKFLKHVNKRVAQTNFSNLGRMVPVNDGDTDNTISDSQTTDANIFQASIDPETYAEPEAEPTPDWDEAIPQWGAAWPIHVYSVAVLSLLIAIYSFIVVVRLHKRKNLVSRQYFIALNIMLVLFGTLRALSFFIDAYNHKGIFYLFVSYILFDTALPCLTSAFSIQLVSLLQALKVQTISMKIQNARVLILIIVAHFILSILTDITVTLYPTSNVLLVICQVFFITWGLFLVIAYFYVFRRLYSSAKRRQKEMEHLVLIHQNNSASKCPMKKPKLTMMLALKMTLITCVFGFLIIVMQIFSIFTVFGVLTLEAPEPWPWWVYQYSMRILELGMAIIMAYVASQPMRYKVNSEKRDSKHCCSNMSLPCLRVCVTSKQEEIVEIEELKTFPYDCSQMNDNDGSAEIDPNHKLFSEGNYHQHSITMSSQPPMTTQQSASTINSRSSGKTNGVTSHHKSSTAQQGISHSMLVDEDGFIRFRQEDDPLQHPLNSTEDELDHKNSICTGYDKMEGGEKALALSPASNFSNYSFNQCLDTSDVSTKDLIQQDTSRDEAEKAAMSNNIKRSTSVPNTESNTPVGFLTPKSLCSTDFDGLSGFSYKPPSSIHLKESIDKALNSIDLTARKESHSDSQELSDNLSPPKTPDSLGNGNPAFRYNQNVPENCSKLSSNGGNKHRMITPNHSQSSKTDLLRENLAEMRS